MQRHSQLLFVLLGSTKGFAGAGDGRDFLAAVGGANPFNTLAPLCTVENLFYFIYRGAAHQCYQTPAQEMEKLQDACHGVGSELGALFSRSLKHKNKSC